MKIVLFRKKVIIAIVLVAVISVAAIIFSSSIVESSANNLAASRKIPIYSVNREDSRAAISFDAAWGNEDTQQIIDILARYDVKATFFVVGEWVDKYPESVKALHDAGHEIMNHSDTHPYMTKLSAEQMLAEINGCSDKIESVTGVRPILFRPPYGDYNDTLVQVLEDNGCYCVQWDVDSLDWKNYSADEIASRVLKKAQAGSIVLFHNAAPNTPAALPSIIESLQAQGIELEKNSELNYRDNYKIDHTGKQYLLETAQTDLTPDPNDGQTAPTDHTPSPEGVAADPAATPTDGTADQGGAAGEQDGKTDSGIGDK